MSTGICRIPLCWPCKNQAVRFFLTSSTNSKICAHGPIITFWRWPVCHILHLVMGLKTIHPCFRFSRQKTDRLVDVWRCEQHTNFLFAMFRFVWACNTPNSNRVSYLSITNQQFTVYPIYVPLTNPLSHHGNLSYFSFGIGIDHIA